MTHAFVGMTVLYRLTASEASAVNKTRDDAFQDIAKGREKHPGYQDPIGNTVHAGDAVPMTITVVWPISVNGQAILDGNDSLWVTSAEEGEDPGQWSPVLHG